MNCDVITYFLSLELGFKSRSIMPRVRLLANLSCLCSDGFILPTSGSHTITSSFIDDTGDGEKKFAPDSCKFLLRFINYASEFQNSARQANKLKQKETIDNNKLLR